MTDYKNLIKVLGHLKMAENLLETASLSDKWLYNFIDAGNFTVISQEIASYMAMNADLDDNKPVAQNQAEKPQIRKETPKRIKSLAKLTEGDVRDILGLIHSGCKPKDIARRFNVSPTCIYDIALGKTWRHIERPSNFKYKNRKIKVSGVINFAA